jgi:hypothetical protein
LGLRELHNELRNNSPDVAEVFDENIRLFKRGEKSDNKPVMEKLKDRLIKHVPRLKFSVLKLVTWGLALIILD